MDLQMFHVRSKIKLQSFLQRDGCFPNPVLHCAVFQQDSDECNTATAACWAAVLSPAIQQG